MHVGPLITSAKTEVYNQCHWVGAGQTGILSPNTSAQYVHTQHFVYGMLQSFLEPINRKSRNTRKATVEGSRQEYPEHQQPHENRIAWPLNNLKNLDSLSNRGRTKAKQRKTQPMRQNVLNLNLILKTNDYLKEIAAWTILVKQMIIFKKIWTILDWSILASFLLHTGFWLPACTVQLQEPCHRWRNWLEITGTFRWQITILPPQLMSLGPSIQS